ncbi:ABC transporter ATP-binding protein [Citroniella saccharovorans]|uniref:ABC transporter ATP-binding protein n=1 Tax=Citroniella saccharovorans TaxID=2053367 RepID=A0AAW9MSR1_9FIRM|nr:ABC transporter ATP-binding protein [Citroniella saccharovorans]MEB3430219.1 ABC transporter ATP-binding protein [Citroniella saccharovorans]
MGHNRKIDPNDQRKLDKSTLKTLKRLSKYLKPHVFLIFLTVIFGIVGTIFDILGPLIMGNTTNYVIDSLSEGNFLLGKFMNFIYKLIIIFLISYFAEMLRLKISNKVKVSIIYTMREDLSKKLKSLPISFFDKNPVGDLMSRMTSDIQTLADSLNQVLNQIFNSLVVIVGITIIMLSISPILTLITIFVIPLTALFSVRILKKSQELFSIQYKDLGNLNSHIEEMISANKLVKAYNFEESALNAFLEKNERLKESSKKSDFLSGIIMPISMFINNAGMVGVSIGGSYMILKGSLNIGNFQSFVQYARRFTRPVQMVTEILNVLQSGIAASERIFKVLDAEEKRAYELSKVDINNLRPSVEFKNVTFSYNKKDIIIDDFSLDIKEGSTTALVGETGSGKTTLVNLLMRFYEPDKGSILIDGVDIKDISDRDLRTFISMVLQDTWLFKGTIGDNISYGRESLTDAEIKKYAQNAYADDFIMKLNGDYNFKLEEDGEGISEGQKQLITIARALALSPKILILDEATSSIDTKTERSIQKAMEKLVEGRTSIIIAHRLSTIINADQIVVLKDGKIIEKGKHFELLERGGYYKELYTSQF